MRNITFNDSNLKANIPANLNDKDLGFYKWVGGKKTKINDIARFVPTNISHVIEPFAGGMALSINIARRGLVDPNNFYLGDNNDELINFLDCLRIQTEELVIRLLDINAKYGLGCRELFKKAVDTLNGQGADMDKAIAFYVYNQLTTSYKLSDGDYKYNNFAPSLINNNDGLKRHNILKLPLYADLIHPMDIKCRDYRDTMAFAGGLGLDAFMLVDSPYLDTEKASYGERCETFDFDELAKLVLSYKDKCNIMVTIDDDPSHLERFAGLKIYRREHYYGTSKKLKGEWLMTNYDVPCEEYLCSLNGFELEQAA
ncbi:hypothetical protein MTBPR1_220008 [Candidatus Terasakiella magnetica]|uniref:site-specific DNA-methyltransferase (adenine-specific) n=1 Tax=Candidatus Terasakiella magnetica TaxID=1867952 RepID=A0A1C3RH15_9PROT|nr:DNA adenine methylase [Candidatus Terasakiella magnetica]SCA56575.1 hypothetical protein MTBPR1_220008 [Candidatus Terasakiella magnetica]